MDVISDDFHKISKVFVLISLSFSVLSVFLLVMVLFCASEAFLHPFSIFLHCISNMFGTDTFFGWYRLL